VLAAALLAALPVILSTAHALATGWTPVGDDAVIAVRAYDVLTSHSPLVGLYSATSEVLGRPLHSLGPMPFWLLALPARFGGAAAMAVTMGLANGACSIGVVLLARRRGGTALMVAAAIALAVMSGSLVGHTYSDVWTPAAGILPFTLLVVLAWSVGCGDHRLLPLTALVASFVVQCHLTFLPPAVGLLAVAAAGLVLARRRAEASAAAADPIRRSLLLAAAVLLLCWIAPLIDQAVNRPGNLAQLARTAVAGQPTYGVRGGGRAVADDVGAPPWWLQTAHSGAERLVDVAKDPGAFRAATALLVLGGLVALLVVALRRGRAVVAVAAGQALVLSLALGAVAASTPTKGLLPLSLGYTLWWGTAAGAWAWLTLACGAAALLLREPFERRRGAALALAACGVAAAIVSLAAAGPGEDVLASRYAPMRRIESRLTALVPPGSRVLVAGSRNGGFDTQFDYAMGSVYALRRHGARVLAETSAALGRRYRPGGAVDWIVRVEPDAGPLPAGARLVQRVGGGRAAVRVTLAPAR
jgi:hypothetical protein